jgi:hypothetical protein
MYFMCIPRLKNTGRVRPDYREGVSLLRELVPIERYEDSITFRMVMLIFVSRTSAKATPQSADGDVGKEDVEKSPRQSHTQALPPKGLEAFSQKLQQLKPKPSTSQLCLPKTHRQQTHLLYHSPLSPSKAKMTLSDDERNGVFDIDEELVPVRENKHAGVMEVDFDGLLAKPLRLEEDLKKGCGGMLWPAGMVMAKYLMRQDKEMFRDKTMFVAPSLDAKNDGPLE